MTEANTLRGEVVFNVGGRFITLRPTFDSLVKIEQITGETFFEYVQNLNASTAKVSDVAKITAACSVDNMTTEQAGEAIFEFGVIAFINGPFSELILRGAGFHESLEQSGGDSDEGKDQPNP